MTDLILYVILVHASYAGIEGMPAAPRLVLEAPGMLRPFVSVTAARRNGRETDVVLRGGLACGANVQWSIGWSSADLEQDDTDRARTTVGAELLIRSF